MSKELEKIIETPIYTIGDEENKIIVFEDGGGFIYGNNAQKVINKLKVLEIIEEKEVNVFIFLHSGDLETYNDMVEDNRKLTQEEYDLLKEVL